jgi:hypothetical protein
MAILIGSSCEWLEERIYVAESRIDSRLANLEDKVEASRQDISDELGDFRIEIRKSKVEE